MEVIFNMVIKVKMMYDDEANVWIAENESIGLILESESYDDLVKRVRDTVPELIHLNHLSGFNQLQYQTLPLTEAIAL